MLSWVVTLLAGAALGGILYGCVRVRMVMGPAARERHGAWARRAVWVVSILAMIALANFGLLLLRGWLVRTLGHRDTLWHEVLFCALAVAVGYWLVSRRATRDREPGGGQSCR